MHKCFYITRLNPYFVLHVSIHIQGYVLYHECYCGCKTKRFIYIHICCHEDKKNTIPIISNPLMMAIEHLGINITLCVQVYELP